MGSTSIVKLSLFIVAIVLLMDRFSCLLLSLLSLVSLKAAPADIVAFYGRRPVVFAVSAFPACKFCRSRAWQNETINTEVDSSLFCAPVVLLVSCFLCSVVLFVVPSRFVVYKSAWPSAPLEVDGLLCRALRVLRRSASASSG